MKKIKDKILSILALGSMSIAVIGALLLLLVVVFWWILRPIALFIFDHWIVFACILVALYIIRISKFLTIKKKIKKVVIDNLPERYEYRDGRIYAKDDVANKEAIDVEYKESILNEEE